MTGISKKARGAKILSPTPKIGCIQINRIVYYFLENSFTTFNIKNRQIRRACYLAMFEKLGKNELVDI